MRSRESEQQNSLLKEPPRMPGTSSGSQENPPQFPSYVPSIQPKPSRVVKFSHFLLVVLVLLILIGMTAGIASFYANQLQDYNRLQSQYKDLSSQYFALQNEVQRLKIQTSNPTLVLWNSCYQPCTMVSGNWRGGGVPDTFDYNVSYTSTIPVTVYVMTLQQYVQFANCTGMITCVSGNYTQYGPTTSLRGTIFTQAEGCASYVAIFQSSANGIIYPNVSVTYNPAPHPTGVC